MQDSHPIIAKEGWSHLSIIIAIAFIVTFTNVYWSIAFWVLVLFVLQFFRDPHRNIPQTDNALVAPADGRVIQVGPSTDPVLNKSCTCISIFMNVFNVHSNRVPIAGEITTIKYQPGKFINAALEKASKENESNALSIKTENGVEITFVQIAGLIARRILCYVNKGDKVATGQRYGFIKFGSRVDLYFPKEAEIKVAVGDKVSAGVDVVAILNNG